MTQQLWLCIKGMNKKIRQANQLTVTVIFSFSYLNTLQLSYFQKPGLHIGIKRVRFELYDLLTDVANESIPIAITIKSRMKQLKTNTRWQLVNWSNNKQYRIPCHHERNNDFSRAD